jgi:hypothetical protein
MLFLSWIASSAFALGEDASNVDFKGEAATDLLGDFITEVAGEPCTERMGEERGERASDALYLRITLFPIV